MEIAYRYCDQIDQPCVASSAARCLLRLRLFECRCRDVDQLGDLVVGEAGEPAEVARQMHGVLVALAAEPAEAEQLVDGLLEVERLFLSLRVLGREAPQPVAAHLHVRDLVGQHPVLGELEHRIGQHRAEVAHGLEHVDRQTLQAPG